MKTTTQTKKKPSLSQPINKAITVTLLTSTMVLFCKYSFAQNDQCEKDYPDQCVYSFAGINKPVWDSENSVEELVPGTNGTVYVTGGYAPYKWTISGAEFSFDGQGLTTVEGHGDNIDVYASNNACGSATIKVTDLCDTEVQGTVTAQILDMEWDWDNSPQQIASNGSGVVHVIGGNPPYNWTISGTGFSFDGQGLTTAQTGVPSITVHSVNSCGTAYISVTDKCGKSTNGAIRASSGQWKRNTNLDCSVEAIDDQYANYWYEEHPYRYNANWCNEVRVESDSNGGCITYRWEDHGQGGDNNLIYYELYKDANGWYAVDVKNQYKYGPVYHMRLVKYMSLPGPQSYGRGWGTNNNELYITEPVPIRLGQALAFIADMAALGISGDENWYTPIIADCCYGDCGGGGLTPPAGVTSGHIEAKLGHEWKCPE